MTKRGNYLYVLGITVMVILFTETCARIIDLPPELYRLQLNSTGSAFRVSDNPVLGYEFKKSYSDDNPDLYTSFPSTNSHGFRDIERTYEKGSRRIIVLGDSVVAGTGIFNLNDTIPGQLEAMLNAGGHNWEVLNFGVIGYSTYQELELLKQKGPDYDPDIVILFFSKNDHMRYSRDIMLFGPEINFFLKNAYLKSRVFRHLATRFNWFGMRFKTDPLYRQQVNNNNAAESGESLQRLIEFCRDSDIELFAVMWPNFPSLNNATDTLKYWQEDRIFLEFADHARSQNVGLIDVWDTFAEDYRSASPAEDFNEYYTINDTIHPNERGTYLAAKAINKSLIAESPG
ncbi:MAG: SGNH/GDSL hydrolase family protein [archaeon]